MTRQMALVGVQSRAATRPTASGGPVGERYRIRRVERRKKDSKRFAKRCHTPLLTAQEKTLEPIA